MFFLLVLNDSCPGSSRFSDLIPNMKGCANTHLNRKGGITERQSTFKQKPNYRVLARADSVQVKCRRAQQKHPARRQGRSERAPRASEWGTQPRTMRDKEILSKKNPSQSLNDSHILFELPLLSKWRRPLSSPGPAHYHTRCSKGAI